MPQPIDELPELRFLACSDDGTALPLELLEAAVTDGDPAGGSDGGSTPAKPKGPKRFKGVAYTGGKLSLPNFSMPVVIDLAGMKRVTKALPLLRDHKLAKPVGHIDRVEIGQGSLRIEGAISASNKHAKEVRRSAKNKFPWQLSVGAKPLKPLSPIPKGETVNVNGRVFAGPILVARETELREVSATPVGADSQSTLTVAASATLLHEEQSMTPEFKAWLEAKWGAEEVTKLNASQLDLLKGMFDADQPPPAEPPKKPDLKAKGGTGTNPPEGEEDNLADFRARRAAEMKRIDAVEKLAKDHPEIAIKATLEGWDETKVELEVLRASRPKGGLVHQGGKQAAPDVILAALCMSHGMSEERAAKHFKEETIDAAVSRQFRGIGLHFLMHETIRAAGMHYQHGVADNGFIRAALEADQRMLRATSPSEGMLQAAGEFSTTSLSGILSNLANKTLLDSFVAVEAVGPRICSVANANDFKQRSSYRLTQTGEFELVGPDGELHHGQLSDETYNNQVKTRGKILSLTREQMINDDLGAFLQIPKLLGRNAALARERAIFTLLLANGNAADGNPFFHTAHANIQTGGGTALDIDSLTTAEAMFLNQVDSAGEPVLLAPAILLVPTPLKTYAGQLMADKVVVGVPASNKLKPATNPHAGKWTPLSSPFLNAQGISGSSSTGWYLIADPDDVPMIEIAYLHGVQTPIIENAEANFNVLGMQWRGYYDFGVAMQDYRAGVESAGV